MGDFVKAACSIEAGGDLVGDRLIVDKAVCACRADGLFVKTLGVEFPIFDSCNLRPYQCRAVFEILGAILRPHFELSVVSSHCLEVLLPDRWESLSHKRL